MDPPPSSRTTTGQASPMRPTLQRIVTAGPRQSRLGSSPLVPSPLGRTAPLTPHETSLIQQSLCPNDTTDILLIAAVPSTITKIHGQKSPFSRPTPIPITVCSSFRPVRPVDIPPTPRAPVSAIFTALPDIPFSPISAALSELDEPRSACTQLHIELQRAAMEEAAYKTRHLRIDPQSIRIEGEHAHSWGSFGEVWRGSIVGKTGELERVAVKKIHLRSGDESNQRLLRHLLREVVPWYELDHPNITPFIGYIFDGRSARMVSKWQEGGNVKERKKIPQTRPCGCFTSCSPGC